VKEVPPQPADHGWPYAVAEFLAGRQSRQDIETAQKAPEAELQRERECDGSSFLGEYDLISGHPDSAAILFRRASEICPRHFTSGLLATVELSRIQRKAPQLSDKRSTKSAQFPKAE
jgi:hypothetical protein